MLTAEQRTGGGGQEPDGTAETLWGRMKGKMGDRAQAAAPEGLEELKAKRAAARKREAARGGAGDDDLAAMQKRRKVGEGG